VLCAEGEGQEGGKDELGGVAVRKKNKNPTLRTWEIKTQINAKPNQKQLEVHEDVRS